MGGEIGVTSVLGVGSTFYFTAQVGQTSAAAPVHDTGCPPAITTQPVQLSDPVRSIRGAKVLLVEDNTANQLVATAFLEAMGLVVELANDGREAVQKVSAVNYDVVLMDLQMPVMDGFEATRVIRGLENGSHLPIIAMTAAALAEDRQAAEDAGMNEHLSKPIEPTKLAQALLKWIPAKDFRT